MKRVYVSYDEGSLRGKSLDHLAALFNYRNHPSASEFSEVVVYRNAFGDLFEVQIRPYDAGRECGTFHVWSASGGALVTPYTFDSDFTAEDLIVELERYARRYSEGFIVCSDCNVPMRRFSQDIVLAYHGGRYCATCAPKYERLAAREFD